MHKKLGKGYLEGLKKRYKKARKSEKKIILDELTKTAGYTRKYAIVVLRGLYKYKVGKISRPRRKIHYPIPVSLCMRLFKVQNSPIEVLVIIKR